MYMVVIEARGRTPAARSRDRGSDDEGARGTRKGMTTRTRARPRPKDAPSPFPREEDLRCWSGRDFTSPSVDEVVHLNGGIRMENAMKPTPPPINTMMSG